MAVTTIGNNVGLYSSVKVMGTSSTTPSSSTTSSVKAKANAINASTTVKSSATQAKTTASTTVSYSSSSSTAKVSSTTASTKSAKTSTSASKTSCTTASTTVKTSSTTAVLSNISSNTPKTMGETKQEYELLKNIADIAKGIVDGTLDVVKGVQEFVASVGEDIDKYFNYMAEEIEKMNDVEDEELFKGMTYEQIKEYRYEHAISPLCKKLYEKYEDEIDVDKTEYTKDGQPSGRYEYFWNEIYLNESNDAINERGYANTYFHEVGHCLDDVSDFNGCTSNDMNYDFIDVLREDYENLLARYQKEYKISREEAYNKVNEWLREDADMKNGISDALKGLSNGQIDGKWDHPNDYYTEEQIERETFANFFEAGMSYKPQKLLYILEVFPNSYKKFQEMLEDELS